MDDIRPLVEHEKCEQSVAYFVNEHCRIYDATAREWIPFRLWTAQKRTLRAIHDNQLAVILKARQLGLTWLCLAFALWLMLFHPAATVMLFSKRDDEATHLLDFRLHGMYERLPEYLKSEQTKKSAHEWRLLNGSVAKAFPTTAGDTYTASFALVDEADLVENLDTMMRSVKPTIDGGGRMVLLSRSDKSKPQSPFKKIYRAAKAGKNSWRSVFLPWHVRPSRDEAWYEEQKRDVMSRTGALDDLHEQYPATDAEALAPATLDKRIPPKWIQRNYEELEGIEHSGPAINGLTVYEEPDPNHKYVIGGDPAEGNPSSDDSAATVLHLPDYREVASLAGKFQPSTLAAHMDALGQWYNDAPLMVERNNHGHAVILWLEDNSNLTLLDGHDGKTGWHSTTKGKAILYDTAADYFRDDETTLHSFETFTQLCLIEGSTLRAPEGEFDDRADSYALALAGADMAGMTAQGWVW